MNTSYDLIYQTFLNNCKVNDIDLPQTDGKKYEAIKNAVLHFNNRLRDSAIKCDDTTETVDRELNEDHLLILAHYIRLIFLINQRTYYENLFQPLSSDVGLRNFNTQMKSFDTSIVEEKHDIDMLIQNTMEDFL